MTFLIYQAGAQQDIGNAKHECCKCLSSLFTVSSTETVLKICPSIKKTVRMGCKKTDQLSISLCVKHEPKSSRLFSDKMNALREVYSCFQSSIKERCAQHKNIIEGRFKELSHNVVTYNAKSIQSAYLLIQQDKLVTSPDKLNFVKNCIEQDPHAAADSFLTILKSLELTKHEFSVYNKLHSEDVQSTLKIQRHRIHKLMQMALNVFWRDFHEKRIRINNSSCDFYALIDFESFMAALIHLMDNMSKYALPDSDVVIIYKKNNNILNISLSMMSFYVFPDEIDAIWQIGYSGKLAKQHQKDGNGLGMHAIKKLIELNNGTFIFNPEIDIRKTVSVDDIKYSHNEGIIEVSLATK